MGYQITWKTKDLPELDSKFKTSWKDFESLSISIQEAKLDFIVTLLKCNNTTVFQQEYKIIKFKYTYYKFLLQEKWKLDLQKRLEEEEIWFYGWEYSRDESYEDIDNLFEELIILAFTTKESDSISNSEYFTDKKVKINDILVEMEDNVIYTMSHEFVDTYREYQIKDDETD